MLGRSLKRSGHLRPFLVLLPGPFFSALKRGHQNFPEVPTGSSEDTQVGGLQGRPRGLSLSLILAPSAHSPPPPPPTAPSRNQRTSQFELLLSLESQLPITASPHHLSQQGSRVGPTWPLFFFLQLHVHSLLHKAWTGGGENRGERNQQGLEELTETIIWIHFA